MPDLGKATYTLELNTNQYDSGLVAAEAKANAATSSIADKFNSMGKRASAGMTAIGSRLTKVLTVPILAVGVAAGTMAYKFEKSMTDIAALVGVGEQQMHEYHDAIMDMVDLVGKGPQELAKALYFITSAGFEGASALKVLEASAKASAAGLGETELVADAVTSAVNAYGENVLSAARATDIMLAAVREGKAEPAAFAASIGRVVAPANLLGVSFDEVSAAIAAMSLQGLDAAEATTALRGVLLTFARPTVEAAAALKSVGLTAADVRKSIAEKGLMETLVQLKGMFKDNVEGLTAIFGNVRAFVGGQILTGATLKKNEKIFQDLSGAVGDTDEAFNKAAATSEFKLDKAMAQIEKSLTILGGTIMPMVAEAMSRIAEVASNLGERFNNLSPQTKKIVIAVAGILAIAGPTLLFFGALTGAIAALIPVIGAVLTPAGLLVGAIVALGAAMVAAKYAPDQLSALIQKLGLSAEQAEVIVKALAFTFDYTAEVIKTSLKNALVVAQLFFKQIGNLLDIVIGILTLDWKQAWSGMKGLVMDPLNAIKTMVSNWVGAIKNIFKSLWQNLEQVAWKAVAKIAEPFSHLPGRMGKWARDAKERAERELAAIDAAKSADKVVSDFERAIVPGFGEMGTKSGNAFLLNMHGILDPGMVALQAQAQSTGQNIFDSLTSGMNMAVGQMEMAAAQANFAPAPGAVNDIVNAIWDGKVWRDAQGKVLKDQAKAMTEWRYQQSRKAGAKYLDFTMPGPKKGATVSYATPKPTGTGGTSGATGGGTKPPPIPEGLIPIDMQIARQKAAQTKATNDDIAILKQQEDFLRGLLGRRNLSKQKRLEIETALSSVVGELNSINEGIASAIEEERPPLVLISPRLARLQARAANTKPLKDDIKFAKQEIADLKKMLKDKKYNAEEKQQIRMALIAANGKLKQLNQDLIAQLKETPVLWTAKMRIRATKAERTETLKDDLKVQKDELAYLKKLLRNKHLDLEQRATIMEEITRVMNRIKEINKEVADVSKESNDEMKKLAFNIMGERAGFFGTFGSNVFTGGAGGPRMPGTAGVPGASAPAPGAGPAPGSVPAFATGGIVQGRGRGDTVSAMLAPGEVVLNKRQIDNLAGKLGTMRTPEAVFAEANISVDGLDALAAKPRTTQAAQGGGGPKVEKFENHQHFMQPTPDRNREMRMAQISLESVFDSGTYHG